MLLFFGKILLFMAFYKLSARQYNIATNFHVKLNMRISCFFNYHIFVYRPLAGYKNLKDFGGGGLLKFYGFLPHLLYSKVKCFSFKLDWHKPILLMRQLSSAFEVIMAQTVALSQHGTHLSPDVKLCKHFPHSSYFRLRVKQCRMVGQA